MKILYLLIVVLSLTVGCSPSPSPIEYGSDLCDYCKMTIVDQKHGAEAVSDKGKIFKFDAIECMVRFTSENDQRKYSILLVNNYLDTGVLIDAQSSTFLISKNIPSPMGAYLSAFSSLEEAEKIKSEKEGNIYKWPELLTAINQETHNTSINKPAY